MILFDTGDGVEIPHPLNNSGESCEAHGSSGYNWIENGPALDIKGAGVAGVPLCRLIFARAEEDHSFQKKATCPLPSFD